MRDALGASCKVFSRRQGLERVPLLCSLNIIVSRRPAGRHSLSPYMVRATRRAGMLERWSGVYFNSWQATLNVSSFGRKVRESPIWLTVIVSAIRSGWTQVGSASYQPIQHEGNASSKQILDLEVGSWKFWNWMGLIVSSLNLYLQIHIQRHMWHVYVYIQIINLDTKLIPFSSPRLEWDVSAADVSPLTVKCSL